MLKTLILGLGRITSLLERDPKRYHPCTHAGVLLNSKLKKYFKVEGIFDPNLERILQFQKDWNLNPKKLKTNLRDISKESWDFVVIASSSEAHLENLNFAIDLKIPFILCEKPICQNLKQLKSIQKKLNSGNHVVWVNHERRYHPIYQFVKKNLLTNQWGDLKTIHASVLTSSRDPGIGFTKRGGGPLLHDGTHAIDFLDYLFEKVPKIKYSKAFQLPNNKTESRVISLLEYSKEIQVFLEAGGQREYFLFEIDIQTTKGRFILSNDGHKFFLAKESSLYTGFKSLQAISLPKISVLNPWLLLYQEIIDFSLKKSNSILGDLSANIRILQTIEKIYKKADFQL